MSSRIEAFAKYLLRAEADSLCMITGEKIYVMRGAEKHIVGREILSDDAFAAVANELAPGESVETLADGRRQVVFQAEGIPEPVQIEFSRQGARFRLTLRHAATGLPARGERPVDGTMTAVPSDAAGAVTPGRGASP